MENTSDLQEYLRLCQVFRLSSEQPNYYPGTFAMQTSAPTVGQPSLPSADWPLYNTSMSHASASPHSNWTMHTQPPASVVEHRPMHSAGWSLYAPSMNHASTSPHANWTMHTTVGPLTADNLHQSNLQSASTMEHKATEVGTEDHRSPGRTSSHTWSSAPSPSTQETTPPNEHNIEVADAGATSAHGNPPNQDESDGPFKCGWGGCTSRNTFGSHASLLRHVRVQHVAHRSVKCPECRQAFGRLDNMREHRGRRHRAFD